MEGMLRSLLSIQAEGPHASQGLVFGSSEDLAGLGTLVRKENAWRLPAYLNLPTARIPQSGIGSLSQESDFRALPTYPDRVYSAPLSGSPFCFSALVTNDAKQSSKETLSREQLTSSYSLGSKKPPYPTLIRALLEQDELGAARALLANALGDVPADPFVLRMHDLLAVPSATRTAEKDFDRTNEYRWLSTHAALHRGRWVALDGDQLIAHAPTLKELLHKLNEMTLSNRPLVHRVE